MKKIVLVMLAFLFVSVSAEDCEKSDGMQEKLECLVSNQIKLQKKVKDTFPIGAIIHALLSEKDFQAQMGKEWVLMDGRKISKNDNIYKYFSKGKLPDARGTFLRMLNNG